MIMRERRHNDWWMLDSDAGTILFFIGCIFLAGVFVVSAPTEQKKAPADMTSCIDGELAQWDGRNWQPVKLKTTKKPVKCGPFEGVQK